MRPKICVPIVAMLRDAITEEAKKVAALPVEMVEWRVDFYAGYEQELLSIVEELKKLLGKKELVVTLRTEHEGGEPNGSRFPYFALIENVLSQGIADYVDVEVDRDSTKTKELSAKYADSKTKLIGSYHDFEKTPSVDFIVEKLTKAKEIGCAIGKLACMPQEKEDVEILLQATEEMKKANPDYPIITMSMGSMGERSRLYGGLYGSEVSFGTAGEASAPGQVPCEKMVEIFDKIYSGKRHIALIGFMGVGKSTISRQLQKISGKPEIDTDQWIVKQEGRSIPDIFAAEGEEYFRMVETAMIDELGTMEPAIVSCGGGMAIRDINVKKLQALGEVVLLTAEPETIYERVKDSTNRPLLNGNMNVEYISELMEKRRPFYEKAATVKVATDGREISDIAKEILEKCQ